VCTRGIDRRLGDSFTVDIVTTGRHGFLKPFGTTLGALPGALPRVSLGPVRSRTWVLLATGYKAEVARWTPAASTEAAAKQPLGAAVTRDLDVAEESPSPNLNLGTFAGFHVDALIPKESGSAGSHAGPRRNAQSDISC
jgi:hypothetical protein